MKLEEFKRRGEVSQEVYDNLISLLEGVQAPERTKRRAIELCLMEAEFLRKAKNVSSKVWLQDRLIQRIVTLKTHNRTLLICGVGATLVAGVLAGIKTDGKKGSSPSRESHHNTAQNHPPISPFSHESVMSQVLMPRYPNKPFHVEDLPGITLDEKIKILIRDRAALGDQTMKRIHNFIIGDTWEIYFCSPDEGQKLLAKYEKPLPPNMVIASASAWVIEASERKDGGKKGIGVVLLPSDDGISEKLGIHRLAGTIANELTGVIVKFKNLTPPETPGEFTLSNDGTRYSAPAWMHQMAGMYVMQEALSHIIDLVEETRVATDNPQYMPSGDALWVSLCQSLRQGKFDPKDPENYARVYFGIGLQRIGLEQDLISNPHYADIMEHAYQQGVAFAVQEGNKEQFLTVLRSLGTIR